MKKYKTNVQSLMSSGTVFVVVMFACVCCARKPDLSKFEIIDGIYYEKKDSSTVDANDLDNQVYALNREFVYTYSIIKGNDTFQIRNTSQVELTPSDPMLSFQNSWDFAPKKYTDSSDVISRISIKAIRHDDPENQNLNEGQTGTKLAYHSSIGPMDFYETTGLIDNTMNVWLHPFRMKYFRVLELNPFPFIRYPYEIGNSWNWELMIGPQWGDERWITWDGAVSNKYTYRITEKTNIETKLGKLECLVVEATGESRIGSTGLIAYFNPAYGFVKLDYINIDKSKIIMEIEQVK